MAVYAYTVASSGSGTLRGTIAADSPRAARSLLRARGCRVHDLVEVRAGSTAGLRAMFENLRARRSERRVVSFFSELSTLLAAGIPLVESLESVGEQHRGFFRQRVMLLRDRVSSGAGLAEAMQEQADLFDPLSRRMVDVGERTGTLDQVLAQAAAFKHRGCHLRSRLSTALIYPAIVVTAGLGVTIFLMTFVVPKLLASLAEAGKPISEAPWVTRLVKACSDVLLYQWPLLLSALLGAAVVLLLARRSPRMRLAWDGLMLRIPILGELIVKQTVVRLAVTIAALTRSGVPVLEAMQIGSTSVGNRQLKASIDRASTAVGAGRDIGPALEQGQLLPRTVVQVFAVGQASGRLDEMLERLAADYDVDVERVLQRFLAMIEPLLIMILAVFVGTVVMAVILPYLEAGDVL